MKQSICTINWSDVLGGAGVQADSATFSMLDTPATSILTGFAAHNTMGDVVNQEVANEVLRLQFEGLWLSMPPSVIKCGALFSSRIMEEVSKWLSHFSGRVVYDPVIMSPAGEVLLDTRLIHYLKANFLSHVSVFTANKSQLEHFVGESLHSDQAIEDAVGAIRDFGVGAVLLKVGPYEGCYRTYWSFDSNQCWISSPYHDNDCSYGAGSVLSAAVTAFLFKGLSLLESFAMAQLFVSGCIRRGRVVGQVGYAFPRPFSYGDLDRLLVGGVDDVAREFALIPLSDKNSLISQEGGVGAIKLIGAASFSQQDHHDVCLNAGSCQEALALGTKVCVVSLSEWDEALRSSFLSEKVRCGIRVHDSVELMQATAIRPSFVLILASAFSKDLGDRRVTMAGIHEWCQVIDCPIFIEEKKGAFLRVTSDSLSKPELVA